MPGKPNRSEGRRRVLLIGPDLPPYGGMALQGRRMQKLLIEDGISAAYLASNLPFPASLRFCEKLRGLRPFLRSVVFSVRLWKMLDTADVLHILACSWLYFFVIVCPAVLIGRLRRKRVILNYRGGEADAFSHWFAPAAKPFFHMADAVTAPSKFLVEVIGRRVGVPVQVVPNIVDLAAFRYRRRRPIRPKMIVTRHLLKLYDVESVLRAFARVQSHYPEASLLIAGTGDQERSLRELAARLALQSVHFLGHVPHGELPALYDQCDILLNASRADNFPGALAEASAAGLVVISTAAGGIAHTFEDGKSAVLVEPGNWAGLAAGVLRVLQDPDFAAELAEAAYQQCKQYDWKHVRRVLYRVYGFYGLAGAPGGETRADSPAVAAAEAHGR